MVMLPAEQRRWTACAAALKLARDKLAGSWQLGILEIDYRLRTTAGETLSRSLGELLSLEQDFPEELDLWRLLPFIYESLGSAVDAERETERHR